MVKLHVVVHMHMGYSQNPGPLLVQNHSTAPNNSGVPKWDRNFGNYCIHNMFWLVSEVIIVGVTGCKLNCKPGYQQKGLLVLKENYKVPENNY